MPSPFTALNHECNAVFPIGARIAVATLAAVLTLSNTAFAAEGPLPLAEAQHLAVARSRQLSAQNFSVIASR